MRNVDVSRFWQVLGRVSFNDWRFQLSIEKGLFADIVFLHVEADEVCNVTGKSHTWKSRKWRLSTHMTDGEIVQTAFKAVMTAMEHEVREQFKFHGVSIFDPHYDIYKLVELRRRPDALKERD